MAQHIHLPNFSGLADCQLIGLAEKRPILREKVAATFQISRTYADHTELAQDSEIDAVAVSAAYAEQGEIAADLLRAGKHVFMEKPMAISRRQAERILEAARAGGARLMVAYMKRYDPGNLLMAQLAANWRQDKTNGEILFARSHGFCGNWLAGLEPAEIIETNEPLEIANSEDQLPKWLPSACANSYISYLQQYTHNINLLRFLVGAEQTDQIAVETVALNSDGFTGIVSLRLAGVRCVIESASSNYHAWDEHTQLYFEKGWLKTVSQPLFARSTYSPLEIYRSQPKPEFCHSFPANFPAWAYREEAKHFISSLTAGEPFRSSGEDALLDVILNEEIYRTYVRSKGLST